MSGTLGIRSFLTKCRVVLSFASFYSAGLSTDQPHFVFALISGTDFGCKITYLHSLNTTFLAGGNISVYTCSCSGTLSSGI